MKRLLATLLALPLIVAFAVSCDRTQIEEEESVVIEGLQDQLDFAAIPTGDATFSITSNVNWSISQKNLDWVSITPSSERAFLSCSAHGEEGTLGIEWMVCSLA